jgi:ligand-binding SRPBCC domain-containing protein
VAILRLTEVYDTTAQRLFARLTDPARMLNLTPPEFGLSWQEQPSVLALGTVFTLQARRWGMSVRLIHEVVAFEPPLAFAERQQRGPFRLWERQWRLDEQASRTTLEETITVEPPGGMLGLTLSLARIEADVQTGWQYRTAQLRQWLQAEPEG